MWGCNAGYEHPVDDVVQDLVACLEDAALPLMQFTEALAVVQVSQPPHTPITCTCCICTVLTSLPAVLQLCDNSCRYGKMLRTVCGCCSALLCWGCS